MPLAVPVEPVETPVEPLAVPVEPVDVASRTVASITKRLSPRAGRSTLARALYRGRIRLYR